MVLWQLIAEKLSNVRTGVTESYYAEFSFGSEAKSKPES